MSVVVVADLGRPAALINVRTVNFVVFDAKGKVIRRTNVPLGPTDTGASIEIPKSLKGTKVVVYTTNACGVSDNATLYANIRRGKTTVGSTGTSAVAANVVPALAGDPVMPAISFGASDTALDARDRAALDRVIKQVKGRCGTLMVSGFSRHNTKDSAKYLQNLADFRARAVAEYLSKRGIDMWIDYQGFVIREDGPGGAIHRRAEIRWRPA
ncbi:MAG: OmpA family protein [Actinomycetota bacterium]